MYINIINKWTKLSEKNIIRIITKITKMQFRKNKKQKWNVSSANVEFHRVISINIIHYLFVKQHRQKINFY